MDKRTNIASLLAELDEKSPTGFAIALHIEFATPAFLFQTYSKAWSDHYTARGLVLKDPAVIWGLQNTGKIRWRDLREDDPAGVMEQAEQHGLKYGVTISLLIDGSRSVAAFSRGDRDYFDVEIEQIDNCLSKLHTETAGREVLPDDVLQALRRMSVHLTHAGA